MCQWVLIGQGGWKRKIMFNQGETDVEGRVVNENDILLISENEPDVNTITAP